MVNFRIHFHSLVLALLLCIPVTVIAEDEDSYPDDFTKEIISYTASDNFPDGFNNIRCDKNHLIQGRYVFFYFEEKFYDYNVEAWVDLTEFEDPFEPGIINFAFRNKEHVTTVKITAKGNPFFYEYILDRNHTKDVKELPKVMSIRLKGYHNFFFMKDVDFDDEEEVLFIQHGMAQRGECAFAVFDIYSNGEFIRKDQSPFIEFDYITTINKRNKTITINGSGGAGSHYEDVYKMDEYGYFFLEEKRYYECLENGKWKCHIIKERKYTINKEPKEEGEYVLRYW